MERDVVEPTQAYYLNRCGSSIQPEGLKKLTSVPKRALGILQPSQHTPVSFEGIQLVRTAVGELQGKAVVAAEFGCGRLG